MYSFKYDIDIIPTKKHGVNVLFFNSTAEKAKLLPV